MVKRIVVVDYGVGNLYSVQRALEVSGAKEIVISSDPKIIAQADGIVLPGVGSFAEGMQGLRDRGLVEPIATYAHSGRPLLGICLGMQMLASFSEEFGHHEGISLIPGAVVAIPNVSTNGEMLKIPFIGWTEIIPSHNNAYERTVLASHCDSASVYLVHSYHVVPVNPDHLLACYCNGGHLVTAAIRSNNVTGLQFHPERSGQVGLKILSQFIKSI